MARKWNSLLMIWLVFIYLAKGKPIAKNKAFFTVSKVPTNSRHVMLFARTGTFLEVLSNGTVQGSDNRDSANALLEMQSFGAKYKRIKRPNSNVYVAIDASGRVTTKLFPSDETLFREEIDENSWIRYQSTSYGWMLALKRSGKTKKGARRGTTQKSAQFLPLFPLSW